MSLHGVVHIVDKQGRFAPGQFKFAIRVSFQPNGMYVLSLYSDPGFSFSGKGHSRDHRDIMVISAASPNMFPKMYFVFKMS
jgi:hypothetical protein